MSQTINWEQKIAPALRQSKPEKINHFFRVIVEPSGVETDEIITIINTNHGRVHRENNILSALAVEIPFSAIQTLAQSKQVKKIWSDNKVKTC